MPFVLRLPAFLDDDPQCSSCTLSVVQRQWCRRSPRDHSPSLVVCHWPNPDALIDPCSDVIHVRRDFFDNLNVDRIFKPMVPVVESILDSNAAQRSIDEVIAIDAPKVSERTSAVRALERNIAPLDGVLPVHGPQVAPMALDAGIQLPQSPRFAQSPRFVQPHVNAHSKTCTSTGRQWQTLPRT